MKTTRSTEAVQMDDESYAECPHCLEVMSAEDGSECYSAKCEAFRAFAEANQDDVA